MKKYWILIVISVVMIVSIGTFYIQSVLAASDKPTFVIEKITGNEKEVDSLFMTGLYYDELKHVGEEFEMSLEETQYWKDMSFFKRVDNLYDSPLYYSPRIKELQKKHRNFMRGKHADVHLFYENKEFLAYADVSYKNPYTVSGDLQFTIAVLDKQTNKTTSFEQLVPNSGNFWYLDVLKVQVVDDQLKVITKNNMREDDREEIHLYTFDIAKEVLVNDEVILSSKDIEDKYIEITTLEVDDPTREIEHMAFVKTTRNIDDEGFVGDIVAEELIIYDFTLNTTKEVNPESPTEFGYMEESNIYFNEISEGGVLRNAVYDIESEQIINSFDIELSNSPEGWSRRFNNGKLYIVYSTQHVENFVTVINFKSGEILFEGEIKPKDQEATIDQVELSIHDILFK